MTVEVIAVNGVVVHIWQELAVALLPIFGFVALAAEPTLST